MTGFGNWQQEWHEDVFAMDDYHSAPDGTVGIYPPLPGIPYMLSETVGQYSYGASGFNNKYRRAGDLALQTKQAYTTPRRTTGQQPTPVAPAQLPGAPSTMPAS